ncbi:MAG: NAD(P)-binding protein [Acidobacteria bacterium]|nr:NAD(P)-binding protein [Acidobacteriota bacterium]
MFLTDGLPSRSYDCYVIGAGPAGITLALGLARANRTVLLFESGTATEARRICRTPSTTGTSTTAGGTCTPSARSAAPQGSGRDRAPRPGNWTSTITACGQPIVTTSPRRPRDCTLGQRDGPIEQVSHHLRRNLTRSSFVEVYVIIEDGRVFRQLGSQVNTANASAGTDGQ